MVAVAVDGPHPVAVGLAVGEAEIRPEGPDTRGGAQGPAGVLAAFHDVAVGVGHGVPVQRHGPVAHRGPDVLRRGQLNGGLLRGGARGVVDEEDRQRHQRSGQKQEGGAAEEGGPGHAGILRCVLKLFVLTISPPSCVSRRDAACSYIPPQGSSSSTVTRTPVTELSLPPTGPQMGAVRHSPSAM